MKQKIKEITFKQYVGSRIKWRRNQLDMPLRELGEIVGLSASFLSDVENGKRGISVKNMWSIANTLERKLDWFVAGY